MECSDNVGDWEDQPNGNGNEEIQLGGSLNQQNPLDPNWTAKVWYERDAAVLRLRRGKCSTHSGIHSHAFRNARNTLIGWESHGCRIVKAPFKTKKEGITMNIML
ncbi:hypothetical protein MS3_00000274 [Schistosoma haematobium]|uniref:Uncharacterized protein n=1 Tax=Schistosoma haematobium TaxID=6185 RepID=A0A922IR08_SCHHA|nr:hypothetical protein MS3_00000274 [Schistosoma haematobium]KAH9585182.1 hypothetical protein MS3_00000274 [Schistosoma haematobium]